MAQESQKSALIAELARSRQALSTSVRGMGRRVNMLQRTGGAFARYKVAWLSGASVLGFLLAKLPARTKKVSVDRKGRFAKTEEKAVKAGILVTVLKLAFDLARPALTKFLTQRVTAYAQQRFTGAPRR